MVTAIETAQLRACSGQTQGFGTTPGEALNALMARLPNRDVSTPIVILPFNRSDAFFTSTQQVRLQELKGLHETRTPAENDELENLIAAAFDATIARTQAIQNVKA